eukprot:TRINITY_DN16653_c0_g1_i1.p1 TRINITY_DN16653_c0_g1~~TRINITY_DN16653_c0_g1_i1.p1  ORF type:complete len:211 (+),score=15.75 TRINITY_DN16653_c0_g1_i1:67-633(+)
MSSDEGMPELLEGDDEDEKAGEPRDSVTEVQKEPPCKCNQWERASRKRHSITLKCRNCNVMWKTKLEYFKKCSDFYAGTCTLGGDCPHPHIHSASCERHLSSRKKKPAPKRPTAMSSVEAIQNGSATSCGTSTGSHNVSSAGLNNVSSSGNSTAGPVLNNIVCINHVMNHVVPERSKEHPSSERSGKK